MLDIKNLPVGEFLTNVKNKFSTERGLQNVPKSYTDINPQNVVEDETDVEKMIDSLSGTAKPEAQNQQEIATQYMSIPSNEEQHLKNEAIREASEKASTALDALNELEVEDNLQSHDRITPLARAEEAEAVRPKDNFDPSNEDSTEIDVGDLGSQDFSIKDPETGQIYRPVNFLTDEGHNILERNGEPLYFRQEEADFIDRIQGYFGKDANKETRSAVVHMYDNIHNILKPILLGGLGFVAENFIDGAVWKSALSGNFNPNNYLMAKNLLRLENIPDGKRSGILEKIGTIGGYTPQEMLNAMNKYGVKSTISNEIWGKSEPLLKGPLEMAGTRSESVGALQGGQMAQRMTEKARQAIVDPLVSIASNFTEAASQMEDFFRTSLFVHRTKQGDNLEEAARVVNDTFYDYQDISKAEEKIGKRLFTFWTFMAKNIPFHFRMLGKSIDQGGPPVQRTLYHTLENWHKSDDTKINPDEFKSWWGDMLPIRISKDDNGDTTYLLLGFHLSEANILDVAPSEWGDLTTGLMSQILKKPVELMTNTRATSGTPIERFPGEEGSFAGLSLRKRLIHTLKTIRWLAELNRVNPGEIFGQSPTPKEPTGKPALIEKYIHGEEAEVPLGRKWEDYPFWFAGRSVYTYRPGLGVMNYKRDNKEHFPDEGIIKKWISGDEARGYGINDQIRTALRKHERALKVGAPRQAEVAAEGARTLAEQVYE